MQLPKEREFINLNDRLNHLEKFELKRMRKSWYRGWFYNWYWLPNNEEDDMVKIDWWQKEVMERINELIDVMKSLR